MIRPLLRHPELGRFTRFCIVGVANTAVHLGVVLMLVEWLLWRPSLGNVMAFFCANLFSFVVNSRWTFAVKSGALRRYPRFLAVSLTGLLISWASVELVQAAGAHYLLGVIGSVVLVAVSGYVLNRLFVFTAD